MREGGVCEGGRMSVREGGVYVGRVRVCEGGRV